jgi:hypothetical protein
MIARFVDLVVSMESARPARRLSATRRPEDGQYGRESVVRFRNRRTGYVRLVISGVRDLLTSRASPRSQRVAAGAPAPSARGAMTAPRLVTPASSEFIGHTRRYRTAEHVSFKRATHPMKQPSRTDLPPPMQAALLAIAVSAIAGWALTQLIP